MRKLLTILILVLLTYVSKGQQAWTHFDQTNSQLANDVVHCIHLENDTVAWIGTDFGLSKLVGSTFTNYYTSNSQIPANSIRSLAQDTAGTLWVGTFSNGLGSFDGSTWTLYNTLNSPMPDDFVRSLAIDTSNQKWIGTTGGLAKVDSLNNWTIYTMWNSIIGSNNIAAIFVDTATNDKWVGTVNGGLLLVEKDTNLTSFTVQNSGISDNTILGIDRDNLGNTLMASPANGLIVKLSGFGWFTYNLVSSNIPTAGLTSLKADATGEPWIGTFDKGLLYKNGSNFIMYDTSNSPLKDVHITSVKVDGTGKVWIGTASKGLYILDPSLLTGIENTTLTPNVRVYPNPVNTHLNYIAGASPLMIEITDLHGRVILQHHDTREAADVSSLQSGTYLARFRFSNGSTVNKTFIKQ
jgi:ligand-binding sensor domain-containing protein